VILTIEAHGRSYRIEDPGGLIGEALRTGQPYEVPLLEHIHSRGFVGTAVDVGASMGNHSLWLAAICGLKVIAIEPLDVKRLQANVALNDLDVTVWPVGLGDRAYRGKVTGPPPHSIGLELPDGKVPIACLDEFGLENVCLIKIDVEGMEPDVLRGAKDTIHRDHPVLYVEAQDKAAHRRNAQEIPRGYVRTRVFGSTPLEEWEWQR
jgi:FkbM family methyltransferase